MKTIHHSFKLFVASLLVFAGVAQSEELPAGFTEEVLQKVLKGEIVSEKKKNTKLEFHEIKRAYFQKVSPEAYIKLVTNHPKYATLFEEVQESATLKSNQERTWYKYNMDLKIKLGFIAFYINAEGEHSITYPKDATSEGKIKNVLTNHKDKIPNLLQSTRLIPYKGGLLLEEELKFEVKKEAPQAPRIKSYLQNFFTRYIKTFKEELKG